MAHNPEFAEIRKQLEDERERLCAQIEALQIENQNQQDDYGVGNHLADDASEVFTRERNLALRSNAQDILAKIDAALHRLNENAYGICEHCGNAISPDRLEVLPYATLCITCQSEKEHSR